MLKQKRIIVTGAGGGLGHAIATRAAQEGARLALFEKTEKLAAQACEGFSDATPYAADLTDAQAVSRSVTAAAKNLGGLDGLVNNAAILAAGDSNPIDTPLADWQRTLDVNVSGAFLMCKAVLPHLLENGGGSIVSLSSVVARQGSAIPQIAYTASKGALESFTREIAVAYARQNIRANCVAPGPVLTERTAHYFEKPEKWQARRKHIPMGRLGKAEEIAAQVCFLLSDDAGWTTGAVFRVDGGISAAYLVDDRDGQETP